MKCYKIPESYIQLGLVKLNPEFYVYECLLANQDNPKIANWHYGYLMPTKIQKLIGQFGLTTIRNALTYLKECGLVDHELHIGYRAK